MAKRRKGETKATEETADLQVQNELTCMELSEIHERNELSDLLFFFQSFELMLHSCITAKNQHMIGNYGNKRG